MPDFMEAITRGLQIIGSQSMQQDLSPKPEGQGAPQTTPEKKEEPVNTPAPAPEKKEEPAAPAPEKKEEPAAPAPEKKEEPAAWQEYKLSAKEKGVLGDAELEPLTKLFNEAKVPKEVASQVQDYAETLTAKAVEAVNSHLQARVAKWEEASKKDPEIMNEYGKNQEIVRRYLGSQPNGLVEALKETGLLNHPEVIKYFIKQGEATLNDQSTGTGTGTKGVPDMSQTVVNMYKGLM